MKRIILLLGCCLLGWGTTSLIAQQGNVAAGGVATGTGGSVSYSIGQVDYLSASGSNGYINQGLQHPDGVVSLCGTLTYDNVFATVLNNTGVQLKSGNLVVADAVTDANGYYQFNNPAQGSYVLNGVCTKPWGSVNATDALLMLKHFTGSAPLSGLRLEAADVDGTGYVNAADGLVAMKRFVNITNSFVTGDWAFENPMVDFAGANMVVDFKGICFGDVDGSYLPPYIKPEPTIFLENQGVQVLNAGQVVTVPIRVSQAMSAAAVSLIMNYPANALEILDVQAAYNNQSLVYNAAGNELRIAWYTLQPKMLGKDEVLLNVTMKLTQAVASLNFNLNAETSIADYNGVTFSDKSLNMPVLVSSNQGFSLSQNVPNPFSAITQISYTLPEDGSVKLELLDVVGKQISVLEDKAQAAGSYTYTFSGNELPNGVYFYRMSVSTESQQYSQTRRMVISR